MDGRKKESEGGIALPEVSQTTETWGEVTSAGPETKHLQVGDRVYVSPHVGTHTILAGVDYILVREGEVKAREKRAGEAA